MSRVRVVIPKGKSAFAGCEGELVERRADQHGEFVLVRVDGDKRPIRFSADSIEQIDPA